MNRLIKTSVLFTLLTLANIAWSTPITYNFEAESQSNLPFLSTLTGPIVGSFQYDSDTPASTTITGGTVVDGASVYNSTISGLVGSINGFRFFDPAGGAVIGNEVFGAANSFPSPGADFFLLSFDDINGPAQNLSGFSSVDANLGLLTLINVRMFWIENRNSVSAFISDNSLTDMLPLLTGGTLALDFQNENGGTNSLFYDLQITPSSVNVNTPSVLFIFLTGLALIRLRLKKRICR